MKQEVTNVSIWVKFKGLDQFWGGKCFQKIAGGVGKYVRCDLATKNKQFLRYAKLLIEVKMGQEFQEK